MATLASRIEDYLEKLDGDDEIFINGGDCDLVAMHIADALKGVTEPKEIRKSVERSCSDLQDSGLLDDPFGIEPDITELVLNP